MFSKYCDYETYYILYFIFYFVELENEAENWLAENYPEYLTGVMLFKIRY